MCLKSAELKCSGSDLSLNGRRPRLNGRRDRGSASSSGPRTRSLCASPTRAGSHTPANKAVEPRRSRTPPVGPRCQGRSAPSRLAPRATATLRAAHRRIGPGPENLEGLGVDATPRLLGDPLGFDDNANADAHWRTMAERGGVCKASGRRRSISLIRALRDGANLHTCRECPRCPRIWSRTLPANHTASYTA
jgi:hypothetical protein